MGVPKHTQVIGFLNSQEGLVLQILKPVFFFLTTQYSAGMFLCHHKFPFAF